MAGNAVIRIRRDSAADWTTADPVLALGEVGFETDTQKIKVGDGTTVWSGLSYLSAAASISSGDITTALGYTPADDVDLAAKVDSTRTVNTTAPLAGGGDLSANRTLTISAATGVAAGSMSAADKTKLDAITGTNTGDQTSIVGITGTKAQFDTAVTDGNILYVGDVVGLTDGDKGDITVASSGTSWTIDNGVVTLAKQANMATASVVYRKSAGSGAPEVQTLATLKTDLGLTGTNSGDQTITLTGDVTGSGTGSFATVIGSNKVVDGMLRQSAGLSVIGRSANTTGNVADITAGTDGHILRRSGTTLGFGTVPSTSVTGLGTAATQNTGTSGANIPLLNAANTWSAAQTITLSSGTVPLTLGSTGAVDANININAQAGQQRGLQFTVGGLNRWALSADATAEGGANAGTNFGIVRYSDAGGFLGFALSINRSTGVATFGSDVIVPDEVYGAGWDGSLEVPTKNALYDKIQTITAGATLADGDYGDITVGGTGTTFTIDNDVVTYAKMQDVSATNRFLGRITAGAGDVEELTGTQATSLLNVATTSLPGLMSAADKIKVDSDISSVKYDATGAALGSAIADYFTSSISLEASSTYEITCHAYFLKTTAGTVIWTWNFSSAPTMATSRYRSTPITGFTTTIITGAEVFAEATAEAVAALAHAASGSLTTAVRHSFMFTVVVRTNAATTVQLRCTESAGTVTPQAGSYMRARKIV